MRPGQTFRIGTQEQEHPVLRTFMLLSVAGKCPTTIHGGQIFSVPLFLSRKALFLRAFAFCLVDATGQISLVFVLREQISLFFLCWLVDVSIS